MAPLDTTTRKYAAIVQIVLKKYVKEDAKSHLCAGFGSGSVAYLLYIGLHNSTQHATNAHFQDLVVYATQTNAAALHGAGVLPSIKCFISTRFYDEKTNCCNFTVVQKCLILVQLSLQRCRRVLRLQQKQTPCFHRIKFKGKSPLKQRLSFTFQGRLGLRVPFFYPSSTH
jgi:hypothetical protein